MAGWSKSDLLFNEESIDRIVGAYLDSRLPEPLSGVWAEYRAEFETYAELSDPARFKKLAKKKPPMRECLLLAKFGPSWLFEGLSEERRSEVFRTLDQDLRRRWEVGNVRELAAPFVDGTMASNFAKVSSKKAAKASGKKGGPRANACQEIAGRMYEPYAGNFFEGPWMKDKKLAAAFVAWASNAHPELAAEAGDNALAWEILLRDEISETALGGFLVEVSGAPAKRVRETLESLAAERDDQELAKLLEQL